MKTKLFTAFTGGLLVYALCLNFFFGTINGETDLPGEQPIYHVCPFKLCPMQGCSEFNGCGSCEKGSDCYRLDSVHWEHPTWEYDECEAAIFPAELGVKK